MIATLESNGTKPADTTDNWLRSPVSQFFTRFNWDNHSIDVQAIKQSVQTDGAPLSLTLSVSQFFGSIAWDGYAVAAPTPIPPAPPPDGKFTLDDFSSLF